MGIEIIQKENIRPRFSYIATVYTSKIEFKEPKKDLAKFREKVESKIKEAIYKKQSGSLFSEGFVDIKSSGNMLNCAYVKQSSFLQRDIVNSAIQESHIKNISSSNMVKVKVIFNENEVISTFYGGNPQILTKAMNKINIASKTHLKSFKELDSTFTKEDMGKILDSFSDEINELRIDPGDCDKLKKIAEEKNGGENEKAFELLYEAHVTFAGIKVKKAPYVKQLINEAGIFIRQIKGKILFEGDKINCEVNSSGRVNIILPSRNLEENELEDLGEKIYNELIENKIKKIKMISLANYEKKGDES
ncbi:MAG: hypothetical protein KKG94_00350 [Nanoarchaeota archaeon]|nr:hypothetical protein [Nanoarchaeota archaeon]